MLSRAVALLPEGDADRRRLLPDLGRALCWCGDFGGAIGVLDEAIERAEAAGDRRTRSYALLLRGDARTWIEPEFAAEEALSEAKQVLRVFEELGDERGQAHAWFSLASHHRTRGQYADARNACERALAHATAAGDEPLQARVRPSIGFSLLRGAAPLDEVVPYMQSLLDQADAKALGGRLLVQLAHAHAMRGQFELARRLIAEQVAAHEDLGNTHMAAVAAAEWFGIIEMLAGEPAAAERHLRRGYGALEESGMTVSLSTVAGMLANAIYLQGRYEETERYTRIGEETAARDDYASQILWRSARARAFARKGRLADGEQLAREAVTLAEATDDIDFHGDALMALAEVLRLADRPGEAVSVIQEALRLYEQKGNLVSADKARSLLEELPSTRTQ
jgi:tetratricopeptide (TPR) repeat protein